MKKLLVLPLLFGLCCACAPKSLPVPDYPLDSATVEAALEQAGFTVAVNRDLPPNDGCISFGQAVVAWASSKEEGEQPCA